MSSFIGNTLVVPIAVRGAHAGREKTATLVTLRRGTERTFQKQLRERVVLGPVGRITTKKPTVNRVLLAGTGRSGTTWTGRVLGSAANTVYVNEPDNIAVNDHALAQDDTVGFGPYPILRLGDTPPQYEALWRLAFAGRVPVRGGMGHRVGRTALRFPKRLRDPLLPMFAGALERVRPLPSNVVVKSTMTAFCLEWIVANFNPRVVVVQRNPLNVVSSWLDWKVDGKDLHTRSRVHELFVAPYGLPPAPTEASQAALTAWWVGLLTATMARLVDAHPNIVVTTHELLCADPEREFRSLFDQLELVWTDEAAAFLRRGYLLPTFAQEFDLSPIAESEVTKSQRERWKDRLDEREIAEIQDVLDTFPTRGWVRPAEGALALGAYAR